MSLKKFGPKDIIRNTMKTHPSCEFFVTDGQIYYNNIPYTSGTISHGASVPISSGYASLFEMNVDRLSASALIVAGGLPGGRFIGGASVPNLAKDYTLLTSWTVGEGASPGGGSTTQYEYSDTAAAGLQAWWELKSFDEDASSATYLQTKDRTAHDRHGTVTDEMRDPAPYGASGDKPIAGEGIFGGLDQLNTLFFDYSTFDGVNIGTAATWDAIIGDGGTSKMSFAAWVYRSGEADESLQRIFQFGGDGTGVAGSLNARITNGGKIKITADWSTDGKWTSDAAVITDKEWTHVVITYNATSTSNEPVLYINGVVKSMNEDSSPAGTWGGIATDDCYIGRRADTTKPLPFYGAMAQFSVWNIIITSDDVDALYNAALGPPGAGKVYVVAGGYVPSQIVDTGLVYPFVTKDGTRVSLAGLYTGSTYDLDFQYGDVVTGSYPMSASITRELIGWYPVGDGADAKSSAGWLEKGNFLSVNGPYVVDTTGGSRGAGQLDTGRSDYYPSSEAGPSADTADVSEDGAKCADRKPTRPVDVGLFDSTKDTAGGSTGWELNPNDGFSDSPGNISCNSPKWPHYWALKNTLRKYGVLSEHYKVTSSYGIKDQQIINLISIPSIFYGSKIKPGSVSLRWYLTGTLIGELRDIKQNGELIQISGNNPLVHLYSGSTDGVDNVAGVVLYNEGFIAITGAWSLSALPGVSNTTSQITIRSGSNNNKYPPMWIDWGAGANDNCNKVTTATAGPGPVSGTNATNNFESASFGLSFKGTSETQTLTMFAHARRGEINYSNNPTFLTYTASVTSSFFTSSEAYVEDPNREVVNFVSSSYPDYSASFKRQVYISKVGIYDENKNLIGVATMSNPVRKAEDQDLTFKLKIDI